MKNLRLMLTGASGMLGQTVVKRAKENNVCLTALARSNTEVCCDITDWNNLKNVFARSRPDVVINTAAQTDLAACEAEIGPAYEINARAVSFLAELCSAYGAYLIQISTDHYYSGDFDLKHDEYSPITLKNEYARTKYAGEYFALLCPGACVIRTNVVGFRGWRRNTFVEWVIDELRHGKAVTGFTDYHTSSIDADSLAGILMELCRIRPSGVWNIAGGEVTSKYQFITALAFRLGFDAVLVSRGLLSDLQMSAVRAESLGLEVGRAEKMLGRPLPSFSKVIDNLALEYESLKNV